MFCLSNSKNRGIYIYIYTYISLNRVISTFEEYILVVIFIYTHVPCADVYLWICIYIICVNVYKHLLSCGHIFM